MSGIVGYVGKKDAAPIILDSLRRLEYRSYDSAGIALCPISPGEKVFFLKKRGKVEDLATALNKKNPTGTTGISHTRWATHGKPKNKNAHPHHDCGKKIFVVHNGTIENYKEIKDYLESRGHIFISETDTEVLPHLIEDILGQGKSTTLEESVRRALKIVSGAYAMAVIHADNPEKIVAARHSSPLLIGVGDDEHFITSDASSILPYTRKAVYMNDGEFAVITPEGFRIANFDSKPAGKEVSIIGWTPESAPKKGYPHFMLKEIYEEPEAVKNSLRGRTIPEDGVVVLGGLADIEERVSKIDRMIITGCGSSYLAGLVGEYMIEEHVGIPVEVEPASEMRYKKQAFSSKTALLTISQSGETADTLAVLREAKRKKLLTLGITNTVGSTIAVTTDVGIYNRIGPEVGVASTKAFVSQVAILALLTVYLGRQRDMSLTAGKRILEELNVLPEKIKKIFKASDKIKRIALSYKKYDNMFYFARKYNTPIAYEGALKLKEIAYIHAEGLGSGELKHGPLALIDKNFPSIVIAPDDSVYAKILNNVEEIKARKGRVLAVVTEGDKKIAALADDVIFIPKTLEMLTPILSVVPLHMLAYHIGVARGCDVDKSRNLVKSVTVE